MGSGTQVTGNPTNPESAGIYLVVEFRREGLKRLKSFQELRLKPLRPFTGIAQFICAENKRESPTLHVRLVEIGIAYCHSSSHSDVENMVPDYLASWHEIASTWAQMKWL